MRQLISVIVSTYDRPDALDAVLRALAKQTDTRFEIVVADDGSPSNTADLVADRQRHWQGHIGYVWHPDLGFRLAEIRNRAVAESSGDYLVFLDGDCIPSKDFVAQHRRLAEPGWLVLGHRLLLGEAFTAATLKQQMAIEDWTQRHWLHARRQGLIGRLTPFWRLPGHGWRKVIHRNRTERVRGCNMGVWRSDFLKVDGFDADLTGWGHEDSDLAARLAMLGIGFKDGRFATGVLHLWHPPADRANDIPHRQHIARKIESGHFLAVRGLSHIGAENFYAGPSISRSHQTGQTSQVISGISPHGGRPLSSAVRP